MQQNHAIGTGRLYVLPQRYMYSFVGFVAYKAGSSTVDSEELIEAQNQHSVKD